MKKRILALAVIAIGLSMAAYGTLAYFTASDTARNVITSGAVGITVEEWTIENEEKVPYPDEAIHILPGVTVSKIVTVKNEEADAFVRAKIELVIKNEEGQVMELTEETLDSVISIVPNSEYWLTKETDDGWYYYKDALSAEDITEPLFSEVVFSGQNMTNEYQNCTVEVIVDAQAVQKANNGDNALEAAGWPEE